MKKFRPTMRLLDAGLFFPNSYSICVNPFTNCPTRLMPKSYSFYTKVAKSAKKLTTSNSFFADLANFV